MILDVTLTYKTSHHGSLTRIVIGHLMVRYETDNVKPYNTMMRFLVHSEHPVCVYSPLTSSKVYFLFDYFALNTFYLKQKKMVWYQFNMK